MTDPKQTTEYLLGTIDENVRTLIKLVESQGTRIASLEQWRTRATGYSAGAVAVVGGVVGILRFLHV